MGMEITYLAGDRELSFILSPTIVETTKILARNGFEKEVERIFGVSDFGRESPTNTADLLEAIETIISALESEPDLLPYTYSFKIEMPPGSGKYSVGSGMASGIRIRGALHSIEGGLDRCELTRDWWDENGVYHGDKPQDIRNLNVLQTDEHGEIKIIKRKSRTCFMRNLRQLRKFLSKVKVETVRKIL